MKKIIHLSLCCYICLIPSRLISQDCPTFLNLLNATDTLEGKEFKDNLPKLEEAFENCAVHQNATTTLLADYGYKMGIMFYNVDMEGKAIEYFRLSLKNRKESSKNEEKLAQCYYMIGVCQFYLDKYISAIDTIELATSIIGQSQLINKDSILSEYQDILGRVYYAIGNYNQALSIQRTRNFIFPIKDNYTAFAWYQEMGKIYTRLNQFEEAQSHFQEAEKYTQKTDFGQDKFQNLGNLYNDIGLLHQERKSFGLAKKYYEKALDNMFKKPIIKATEIINTYANLVATSTQLNKLDVADNYFKKGLKIATSHLSSSYYLSIAELHRNKAALEAKRNNFQTAFDHVAKSIKSLVPDWKVQRSPILDGKYQPNTAPFFIDNHYMGHKLELLKTLETKAAVQRQLYKKDSTLVILMDLAPTFRTIDSLSNKIRHSYKSADSKYFFQKNIIGIYEKAILTFLELHKLTKDSRYLNEAYTFADKNKEVILLDGLQDEKAKWKSLIPSDLLAKETTLNDKIIELQTAYYKARQSNSSNKDSLIRIMKDLEATIKQRNNLINRFESKYKSYYKLKYNYTPPLRIKTIQEELDSNRALIEYFWGEENLFIFTISKTTIDPKKIALPKDLDTLVFQIRRIIQEKGPKDRDIFPKVAYKLYQYLLEESLQTLPSIISRIIIIPDNYLQQINFETLLDAPYEIKAWNDKNIPYLMKKYAFSQAYSNRLVFNEKDRSRIEYAQKGFGGFGLEYDKRTLLDLKSNKLLPQDTSLKKRISGKLPYSDDEVIEIEKIVGGDIYTNKKATKSVFKSVAQQYIILHFSGHGFSLDESPDNSGIIFSKNTDTTNNIFRAYELLSMKLSAKMVVLSGCQTGYGPLKKGVGMRTLSKYFYYAGCYSLVASLWNIYDQSTKEIQVFFYQNLKKGMPKDVALNQAKKSFFKEKSSSEVAPANWANIVLIGNADAINELNSKKVYLFEFLLVLFLVGAFLYFRRG